MNLRNDRNLVNTPLNTPKAEGEEPGLVLPWLQEPSEPAPPAPSVPGPLASRTGQPSHSSPSPDSQGPGVDCGRAGQGWEEEVWKEGMFQEDYRADGMGVADLRGGLRRGGQAGLEGGASSSLQPRRQQPFP